MGEPARAAMQFEQAVKALMAASERDELTELVANATQRGIVSGVDSVLWKGAVKLRNRVVHSPGSASSQVASRLLSAMRSAEECLARLARHG